MKLLVHTPISNRAWILPEWLDALRAQDFDKDETVVCFDVNESDDETLNLLREFARKSRGTYADVMVRYLAWSEPMRLPDHVWNDELYRRMIQMRNGALHLAEKLGCDYLFSLDSDVILLDVDTISHLVEAYVPIMAGVFTAVWGNDAAKALPNVWERGQNEMSDEFMASVIGSHEHVKVGGLGACTLIRKDVWMAKVNYDAIYNLPSNYRGEDRNFCIRAAVAGFPLLACAHTKIEHRDKPKVYETQQTTGEVLCT